MSVFHSESTGRGPGDLVGHRSAMLRAWLRGRASGETHLLAGPGTGFRNDVERVYGGQVDTSHPAEDSRQWVLYYFVLLF